MIKDESVKAASDTEGGQLQKPPVLSRDDSLETIEDNVELLASARGLKPSTEKPQEEAGDKEIGGSFS